MSDFLKNLVLWIIISAVMMAVFNTFVAKREPMSDISYSRFIADVENQQVRRRRD